MTTRNKFKFNGKFIAFAGIATMGLSLLSSQFASALPMLKEPKAEMSQVGTWKGTSSEKRKSYRSSSAKREDGLRYSDILNHSQSGMVFAEFDSRDGFQAMETPLPDSFKDVRQSVWIPNTDNVALLVTTQEGSDVFLIDCGTVVPITKTHDVLRMSVTRNGDSLSWERSGDRRYSVPQTYYAIDTNNLTVTRQAVLNMKSVVKF